MPDRSLVVPLRNGAGFWRWTDNVWSRLPTPGMPTGTALVIYLDHEQRLWAGYAKDQIGRLANGIGSTLESTGVGDVTAFAETTHGFLAAGVNGVSIDYTAQILKVTCSDDGVGMDEETLRLFSKPGHWGLVGMKERASRIGARLECESSLGSGTKIEVFVPAAQAYEGHFGIPRWLPAWCR